MRHLYRTKKHRRGAPAYLLFALLVALLLLLTRGADGTAGRYGVEQLEQSLRRAAATCYAVEGRYPPTLEYLCDHYGVPVGEGYLVRYEVFAGNLMPDITVTERGAA